MGTVLRGWGERGVGRERGGTREGGTREANRLFSVQMPTFRADPLTPACDNWCEFPVSDRPNAVAQFLEAAETDPSLIKVISAVHIVTQTKTGFALTKIRFFY